jgi:hypothetical protein
MTLTLSKFYFRKLLPKVSPLARVLNDKVCLHIAAHFLKTHFNIILPSIRIETKKFLLFEFRNKVFLLVLFHPVASKVLKILSFGHPDTMKQSIWLVRFLIM